MVFILIALILILYMNASHFDKTEIKTIIGMFIALLGSETATKIFASKDKQ
jgi:hypothetical protein